jgi:phosphatidylglycerol:prolipoprotein diacylglycerol transferase
MSFHGGMLGVILATFFYARSQKIPFGRLLDFVAVLTPLGLALGRLGNFIGQELWGRPTTVPWAMVFPRDPLQLPRHPSQLYQFALEGLLLFAIMLWVGRKPRPPWALGGTFVLGYGVLRFFAEFFREPDAHLGFQAFGWMTRGQLLCVPMIGLGLYLLWYAYRNNGAAASRPA